MSEGNCSLTDIILDNLLNLRGIFPRPYENGYSWARRVRNVSQGEYRQALRRMQQYGLLKITQKNNKKFIELTEDGQLEALLLKAKLDRPNYWDGKWRLFMFDIPEGSKEKRNVLRTLLKNNSYVKLQASVYISPYPLNREAILYLNNSGLRDYIRILKVEEMDFEKDLLKKFSLERKTKSNGR
jgi:CRISPR-associated endonuclease Cas2